MARKTTKLALELLERHDERIADFEQRIQRAEAEGRDAAMLKARAEQATVMMEEVLHVAKCYHGFQFLAPNLQPTTDESQQEWYRIRFITKS